LKEAIIGQLASSSLPFEFHNSYYYCVGWSRVARSKQRDRRCESEQNSLDEALPQSLLRVSSDEGKGCSRYKVEYNASSVQETWKKSFHDSVHLKIFVEQMFTGNPLRLKISGLSDHHASQCEPIAKPPE
jgi:hypothetical protein